MAANPPPMRLDDALGNEEPEPRAVSPGIEYPGRSAAVTARSLPVISTCASPSRTALRTVILAPASADLTV